MRVTRRQKSFTRDATQKLFVEHDLFRPGSARRSCWTGRRWRRSGHRRGWANTPRKSCARSAKHRPTKAVHSTHPAHLRCATPVRPWRRLIEHPRITALSPRDHRWPQHIGYARPHRSKPRIERCVICKLRRLRFGFDWRKRWFGFDRWKRYMF